MYSHTSLEKNYAKFLKIIHLTWVNSGTEYRQPYSFLSAVLTMNGIYSLQSEPTEWQITRERSHFRVEPQKTKTLTSSRQLFEKLVKRLD